MKEKICCIYKIVNTTNGKCYIGQTKDFQRRKYQHIIELKNHRHSSKKMQNDFDCGYEFVFDIIETVDSNISKNEFNALENKYIYEYDSINNGYNKLINRDGISKYDYQNAFNAKKYDKIYVLVPKGKRDLYRKYSQRMGFKSLSAFLVDLAERDIKALNGGR